MQDHIKRLAIEAGLTSREVDVYATPMMDGAHTDELTAFAQAVARECCSLVDAELDRANVALNFAPSDAIRARFGLEG